MREERAGIETGIILVTVGLLLLANHQGFLSFARIWPVILIVLGVVMLAFPSTETSTDGIVRRGAERRRRSRSSGGLWLVFVGILLLANENHWMSFRDSWPLFIVAGGLSLIFGSVSRRTVADPPGSSMPSAMSGGSGGSGGPGMSGGPGVDDQTGGQWR